jgi:hypothetical protein
MINVGQHSTTIARRQAKDGKQFADCLMGWNGGWEYR